MVTLAPAQQSDCARGVCGAGELDRQPRLADPGFAGQVRQVRPAANLGQQRVQPGQLRAPADEHAPLRCQRRGQRRPLDSGLQRVPVGRLDLGPRIDPELLAQQPAATPVGQQRLGPVPGAQLRPHQVHVAGLAQRT
jgi:hypothetical protein